MTFELLKESLKYQKPKIVCFDLYMIIYAQDTFTFNNKQVVSWNLDQLKTSLSKFNLSRENVEKKDVISTTFSFFKYHTRWKNLINTDYYPLIDEMDKNIINKGFQRFYDTNKSGKFDYSNFKNNISTLEISSNNMKYLNKIIDLCKINNINLICTVAPFDMSKIQYSTINTAKEMLKKLDIPLIDYNLMYSELNLDTKLDFKDNGHLNFWGSEKVSNQFSKYLKENFKLEDKRGKNHEWDLNVEEFYFISGLETANNIDEYLNLLSNNKNYTAIISVKSDGSKGFNDNLFKSLQRVGLNINLGKKTNQSYLGVVKNSAKIYEKSSTSQIAYSHRGDDKINFSLSAISTGTSASASVSTSTGITSSIKINNIESSKDLTGINIVVYDDVLNEVVDTVNFDPANKFMLKR